MSRAAASRPGLGRRRLPIHCQPMKPITMNDNQGVYTSQRQVEPALQRHVLREPVVVLSDLHLNRSDSWKERLDQLRRLWAGAATVVFNGDTLDWFTAADTGKGEEILAYLRRLCGEDGTRPILLAGNSDNGIAPDRHVFLGGGGVLVTHGDVLFPGISPWRARSQDLLAIRRRVLREMTASRRATLEGQLASASRTMSTLRQETLEGIEDLSELREAPWWRENPAGLVALLRTWWVTPKMAVRFLAEFAPQARAIVIGHTHRSGVWERDGRTVINTGSFARAAKPLTVWVSGDTLTARTVTKERDGLRPGRAVASFSVQQSGRCSPAQLGIDAT